MFESAAVLREFEATTGVRLKRARGSVLLGLFMRLHPRFRQMPRLQVFEASRSDVSRFDGAVTVEVSQTDDPDRGTHDSGIKRYEIERGTNAGKLKLFATAVRANVMVTFLPHASEVTPAVESTWSELTAFLARLQPPDEPAGGHV